MHCWHGGKKVVPNYGNRVGSGDIVQVTLNLDEGTLSFSKEGETYGTAFTNLPRFGAVYYPAFSLFNTGDTLELISSPEASAKARKHPGPREAKEEAPATESIPFGMAPKVAQLEAMGYPKSWCVKALTRNQGNIEAAAEYILLNSAQLESEQKVSSLTTMCCTCRFQGWLGISIRATQAEEAQKRRSKEEEVKKKEEAFFMELVAGSLSPGTGREGEGGTSSGGGGGGGGGGSGGGAEEKKAAAEAGGGGGGGGSAVAPAYGPPSTVVKGKTATNLWGWHITVLPDLSSDQLQQLAKQEGTKKRLAAFQQECGAFSAAQDRDLIQYADTLCQRIGEDPLTLNPDALMPGSGKKDSIPPSLRDIPPRSLRLRFLLLRNFNRRLADVLPLIDLAAPDSLSQLAARVRAARDIIFPSIKRGMWNKVHWALECLAAKLAI